MDTMTATKVVAGFCGAFLVFLLGKWVAEVIYHVDGHGEAAYVIDTGAVDTGGEDDGPSLEELLASADIGKGAKVFKKCAACHKVEAGANLTGPSLYGVVGRDIASVDGFGYSSALVAFEGDWTPEALDGFLEKPSKFVQGTSMSFGGLKKDQDRADVIVYLDSLDD